MDIWFWIWVVLAAVLLVAEIFTAGFFMLPFGVAAAIAAVLNFFGMPLVWQFVSFIAISVVLFISLRRFADRITHEPPVKTGANRLVGKTGLVVEEIVPNTHTGQIRIEREDWRADAPGHPTLAVGTHVTVTAVEGSHLVVVPAAED